MELRKKKKILCILAVLGFFVGFSAQVTAKERIIWTEKESKITYEIVVSGSRTLLRAKLQAFVETYGSIYAPVGIMVGEAKILSKLFELAKGPVNKDGTANNSTVHYSGSVQATVENDGTYLFIDLNKATIDGNKISINSSCSITCGNKNY